MVAELSGSTPPGTVWLLSDQSSVEFTTDEFNSLSGFKASYTAIDTSELSGKKGEQPDKQNKAKSKARTKPVLKSQPDWL